MKLHRIRVTNLNSLYGEQQLDLDADLNGASLFLIQGPTGSGKSTLMDAVSLALFGTTPRLDAIRKPKNVAEQVMSRGTGVAIAELEFSKWSAGGDGRVRYRATWKARRAREKPGGKMQDTERSMERLQADGSWVLEVGSKKKTDYEPVFKKVLEEFTTADFQRSMLLAQGQFDAMLHAKPEERAAILERLTLTGDYQRLGERAAQMREAWEGRLAKRKADRDAITPLSGEELVKAKEAQAAAAERMKALEETTARLRASMDWLSRHSALEIDLAAAREAVAAVAVRQEEGAQALAALSAHEACAEAFVALDRHTEDDEALARHRETQQQVAASLPGLAEAVAKAEAALERAQAARAAADGALDALREPATQATSARERRDQALKETDKARAALAGATERHGVAQGAVEKAAAAQRGAGEALRLSTAALAAQRGGEAVHGALPALQAQGSALRERQEALDRGRADLTAQGDALTTQDAALASARSAHQAAWQATVTPRKAEWSAAQEALGSVVGAKEPEVLAAELRDSLDVAQQRREALQHVQIALIEETERRNDHRARVEALAAADVAHQQAQGAQQAAARALVVAQQSVGQAEQRLAPLQRIADLGAQRQVLEEDQPCPLCGSEVHPYVNDPIQRAQAEAIEAEVTKAQGALADAREAKETAEWDHTQAASAAAAAARGAKGAEAEVQRALEALEAAHARAEAAREAAGCAVGLELDALVAEQEEAEGQREALRQRLDHLDAVRKQERVAADALAAAERAHEAEATRLTEEAARLAEARDQRARRAQGLAEDAAALSDGQGQLRAALAVVGIPAEVAAEGLAQAQAQAQAWTQAHEAHARAVVAHDKAAAAHQAATATLAQAEGVRADAAQALQVREGALVEAQAAADQSQKELERVWSAAAALDGPGALPRPQVDRPPAELVAFQAGLVASLQEAQAAARTARDIAGKAHTEAVARQATLAEAEGRLQGTVTERAAALASALDVLSLPDVAALIPRRLGVEALAAARSLREVLRTDLTRAQATEKAASEQLAGHARDRPEDLAADATAEVLRDALAALAEEREAAQAQLDQARTTVEMAARDRASLDKAQAAFADDQAAASVWLHLHELIGVGRGKRFQLFAQALNLDQLLARANRHLEQLNERYHLVSVPDKETGLPSLDFQAEDRWRPGAKRSLKTLSGGESFLVSLALALGLSDLRTRSMPVETLLLDEGFGTLDPATLDTALAALQQLQATGRQVGLISHVVGLQERIEARVRVEPLGDGRSRVVVG